MLLAAGRHSAGVGESSGPQRRRAITFIVHKGVIGLGKTRQTTMVKSALPWGNKGRRNTVLNYGVIELK
jgi:hypothetical protein